MLSISTKLPLRCVIIDDEQLAIDVTRSYVQRLAALQLVACFNNASEAKYFIEAHQPELIISDIKMPGKSGIKLIEGLTYQPYVIFASAFERYAIDGFELGVVDFLRKPFSFQRFANAIQRILSPKIPPVFSEVQKDPFIFLKADRLIHKVLLNNVLYFQALGNYTKAVFVEEKKGVYNIKISSLEELVTDHGFLRIHKSFIVSIAKIESFSNQCVLIRQIELPIGESFKRNVLEHLKNT